MARTPVDPAEFGRAAMAKHVAPLAPTTADVKRAEAVGAIESAQDQVARARRALIAAGEDPSGEDRILRDLGRELAWLRG
jgi:hypothetical protein